MCVCVCVCVCVLVFCFVMGYGLQFGEVAHKRVLYYYYCAVCTAVFTDSLGTLTGVQRIDPVSRLTGRHRAGTSEITVVGRRGLPRKFADCVFVS